MKRLLVLIFAFFIVFEANQKTLGKGAEDLARERVKFPTTYLLVREYEGNYSNHPHDRGGETYGGISRKFNRNWYGWRYVDGKRRKRNNEKIQPAEFWVQDYYLDIWIKEGWDNLYDQRVANYLFEFRINSPVGPRIIQRSLNDCGFGVDINNKIDASVINAIILADSKKLLKSVKKRRVEFYRSIARRDTTQRKFLRHWLKRAENM